eukprot:2755819-Prymnesium_polylepis.1
MASAILTDADEHVSAMSLPDRPETSAAMSDLMPSMIVGTHTVWTVPPTIKETWTIPLQGSAGGGETGKEGASGGSAGDGDAGDGSAGGDAGDGSAGGGAAGGSMMTTLTTGSFVIVTPSDWRNDDAVEASA